MVLTYEDDEKKLEAASRLTVNHNHNCTFVKIFPGGARSCKQSLKLSLNRAASVSVSLSNVECVFDVLSIMERIEELNKKAVSISGLDEVWDSTEFGKPCRCIVCRAEVCCFVFENADDFHCFSRLS